MNKKLKELQELNVDIDKCVYTKKELQEERKKKFRIFHDTMKDINPALSESVIKETFMIKFGYSI